MMTTKIVADSSADLLTLGDLPFASVPLTIHAGDRVLWTMSTAILTA